MKRPAAIAAGLSRSLRVARKPYRVSFRCPFTSLVISNMLT